MEEVQRILEWYESYQRDYPGFAVPLIAHGVATLKFRLYVALGDMSGMIRENSKLEEWKDKLPLPTGSEVSLPYTPFSTLTGFILNTWTKTFTSS